VVSTRGLFINPHGLVEFLGNYSVVGIRRFTGNPYGHDSFLCILLNNQKRASRHHPMRSSCVIDASSSADADWACDITPAMVANRVKRPTILFAAYIATHFLLFFP